MKLILTDKEIVKEIEHLLILKYRPTFLHVTQPDKDGDIQVVVSSIIFNEMSVNERIQSIFNLLYKYLGDIMENRLVIVQALTLRKWNMSLIKSFQKIVIANKSDHFVVYEQDTPHAYDVFEKTEEGMQDLADYLAILISEASDNDVG